MIILDIFGVRLIRGLVSCLFPFSGSGAVWLDGVPGKYKTGANEDRKERRKGADRG